MANWLGLVIGNTRWHWAWFDGEELIQVWHSPHRLLQDGLQPLVLGDHVPPALELRESLEMWCVSVVPAQSRCLEYRPSIHWITQVPLLGMYPTMGLDRAISLLGAGQRYGWPVLVIDGGTALTFTAGVDETFAGGAILLGLRSHLSALHSYTAKLPQVPLSADLPPRWAMDTPSAIQSGVIHTVIASIHQYIQSWRRQYPQSVIIFTGGDGDYLYRLYRQLYIPKQNQVLMNRTWLDANLMFWGIAAYRKDATRAL